MIHVYSLVCPDAAAFSTRPTRERRACAPPQASASRQPRARAQVPPRAPAVVVEDRWAMALRLLVVRTDGVDANGAAAKVMNFDGLGKEVSPVTFGKINAG